MSAILTLRMLFPINGRSEIFDSNVRNELDWEELYIILEMMYFMNGVMINSSDQEI
jgi:hypothetical protein